MFENGIIPADIGSALFILAILALVWLAGHRVWRGIVDSREPEPRTHGEEGGHPMPAPADYSDEVTDGHFKRIAELVDQDPAAYTPAPELGSGERAGEWFDPKIGAGDMKPIDGD